MMTREKKNQKANANFALGFLLDTTHIKIQPSTR